MSHTYASNRVHVVFSDGTEPNFSAGRVVRAISTPLNPRGCPVQQESNTLTPPAKLDL